MLHGETVLFYEKAIQYPNRVLIEFLDTLRLRVPIIASQAVPDIVHNLPHILKLRRVVRAV